MNLGLLLVLIHVNSVLGQIKFGCANPISFHSENKHFFPITFIDNKKQYYLHQIFKIKSKAIGKGGFGVVVSIQGLNEIYIIKILNPKKSSDETDVEREIIILKYVCGVATDDTFNLFILCEEAPIMPFYGCVEDKNEVFIVQQKALYSLKDEKALNVYRRFSAMDRIAVILRILDNIIHLHSLGIIHSDIKPANIVSKDVLLEFIKLIDLGMAGIDTLDFFGGTKLFLAPEYLQSHSPKKLSPQLDIYSLAITIMYLEKGFTKLYYKISSDCFEVEFNEDCHKQLITAVTTILKPGHPLYHVRPIIIQALSYKKEDRQGSAQEVSIQIIVATSNIEGSDLFFHKLALQAECNAFEIPELNKIFTWKGFAKASGYMKIDPKFLKKRASSFFCCKESKKDLKPPIKNQQQQQKPLQLQLYPQPVPKSQYERLKLVQIQLKQLKYNKLINMQLEQKTELQVKQKTELEKLQNELANLKKTQKMSHFLAKIKIEDQKITGNGEKKRKEELENKAKKLKDLDDQKKVQEKNRQDQLDKLINEQQQEEIQLNAIQVNQRKKVIPQIKQEQTVQEPQKLPIPNSVFNKQNSNAGKEANNSNKGELNKNNQDQHLDVQNDAKSESDKKSDPVLNNLFIDNSIPISDNENIPKHHDLGNYNSHSFWGGYLQNVKQQQQSQKLNFLI